MHVQQGPTTAGVAECGAVARVAKRRRVEAAADAGSGGSARGEAAPDAAVSGAPASAPGSGQPLNPIKECDPQSDTPAALGALDGAAVAAPCRHLCKYHSCVLHLPLPCMRDLFPGELADWETGDGQQHYERTVAVYAAMHSQAPQPQQRHQGQGGQQQQGQGHGQAQEPRLWRFEVRLLRRSYLSTWQLVGVGAVATVLGLCKAESTKSLNSVWLSRTADGRLLAEREEAHSRHETHVAQIRPAVGGVAGPGEVAVAASKRAAGGGGGSGTAPAARRSGRGRAGHVSVLQQAAPAAAVGAVGGVDVRYAGRISHRVLWPRSGALELLCPELVVAAHAGATEQVLTVYAEMDSGKGPGPAGAAGSGDAAAGEGEGRRRTGSGEGQRGRMRRHDLRLTLVPQGGKFYASGCGPLLKDLGVSKKSVRVWLRKLEDGRLAVELTEEGRKEREAGEAEAQEASAPRGCNCRTGRGVLWVKVAAVKAVWRERYDARDPAAAVWEAGEVSVYPVAREARGQQVQQKQRQEGQLGQAVKLRLLCRTTQWRAQWCLAPLGSEGGKFRVGKALGLGRSGSGTLRRDGSGRAVIVPLPSGAAGQAAEQSGDGDDDSDGSGGGGDGGGGGAALCPAKLWNCRFNAGGCITIKRAAAPEVFPQECAIHAAAAAKLREQLNIQHQGPADQQGPTAQAGTEAEAGAGHMAAATEAVAAAAAGRVGTNLGLLRKALRVRVTVHTGSLPEAGPGGLREQLRQLQRQQLTPHQMELRAWFSNQPGGDVQVWKLQGGRASQRIQRALGFSYGDRGALVRLEDGRVVLLRCSARKSRRRFAGPVPLGTPGLCTFEHSTLRLHTRTGEHAWPELCGGGAAQGQGQGQGKEHRVTVHVVPLGADLQQAASPEALQAALEGRQLEAMEFDLGWPVGARHGRLARTKPLAQLLGMGDGDKGLLMRLPDGRVVFRRLGPAQRGARGPGGTGLLLGAGVGGGGGAGGGGEGGAGASADAEGVDSGGSGLESELDSGMDSGSESQSEDGSGGGEDSAEGFTDDDTDGDTYTSSGGSSCGGSEEDREGWASGAESDGARSAGSPEARGVGMRGEARRTAEGRVGSPVPLCLTSAPGLGINRSRGAHGGRLGTDPGTACAPQYGTRAPMGQPPGDGQQGDRRVAVAGAGAAGAGAGAGSATVAPACSAGQASRADASSILDPAFWHQQQRQRSRARAAAGGAGEAAVGGSSEPGGVAGGAAGGVGGGAGRRLPALQGAGRAGRQALGSLARAPGVGGVGAGRGTGLLQHLRSAPAPGKSEPAEER